MEGCAESRPRFRGIVMHRFFSTLFTFGIALGTGALMVAVTNV